MVMEHPSIDTVMAVMIHTACSNVKLFKITRKSQTLSCRYHPERANKSNPKALEEFVFSIDGRVVTHAIAQRFLNDNRVSI